MKQPVIVQAARTGIGKAKRGAFNMTHGAVMAGATASAVVARAGIDPALIEDSIWGCGYPEYVTGGNIARQAVIRAGLPDSIAGATVNRFCASGLHALAMAAQMVAHEGARAVLAGGVESISLVQPPVRHSREAWIEANRSDLYMTMIETADNVFTGRYAKGQVIRLPIAHHDGNYFADADTLQRLQAEDRVAVRYCTPDGVPGDAASVDAAANDKKIDRLAHSPSFAATAPRDDRGSG